MAVVDNAAGELGSDTVRSVVLNRRVETTPPPSNQEPPSGGEINGQNGHCLDHHSPNHHDDAGESSNRDTRELTELFSELNPMAEEFVPPSLINGNNHRRLDSTSNGGGFGGIFPNNGNRNGNINRVTARRRGNQRRRTSVAQPEDRTNGVTAGRRGNQSRRMSVTQREDRIRRTVYVSDIDQHVTEEQLATHFFNCGLVVDCRICGGSELRFGFIEFTGEESARVALSLSGTILGLYRLRVVPSRTAIEPVNPTFLPRTGKERELCARTIYCTNIDVKINQADVKLFFESICGEVSRLRLLRDHNHSTHIAFVEFIMAGSATAALYCNGAVLGSLPIRVNPSKTPVRFRSLSPNAMT